MYFKCNLKEKIVSSTGDFLKPYKQNKDGLLESAFFIDKFVYIDKERKIIIDGWCFGDIVSFEDIQSENIEFKKVSRADVSKAFNQIDENLGFNIHVFLDSLSSFSIVFGEMRLDIIIDTECESKKLSIKSFSRTNDELLIVGGAPTVKDKVLDLELARKDIWALNDSVFYLEDKNIKVDVLLISDSRFIDKNFDRIQTVKCEKIIIADYIDSDKKCFTSKYVYPITIKGRDGVSTRKGEAFHGCTVANFSFQVASFLNYKEIKTLGVLLHFPNRYQRLDGSSTMPEFVLDYQISNTKRILSSIRKLGTSVSAIENDSNINFL